MISWQKLFSYPVILLLLCALAYANSLGNQPLIDDQFILQMQLQAQDNEATEAFAPKFFRPAVNITSGLIGFLLPRDPLVFHLFVVLFFYAYCLLLYRFTYLLTGNSKLSLLTASLFCVHPINVMMAGYITGGMTSLYAPFLLASLMLYDLWSKNAKTYLYALSLVFYVVAFLYHEIALIFPLYLSIYILLFRRDSHPDLSGCLKHTAKETYPFFMIALVYVVYRTMRASLLVSVIQPAMDSQIPLMQMPASLLLLYWKYLSNLIYPQTITYIMSIQPTTEYVALLNGCAIILVCSFFWACVRILKDKLIILTLCFLVIGFIPPAFACFTMPYLGLIIEPHWFAFSSIGFFILASHLLIKGTESLPRNTLLVLAVILISVLAFSTRFYNRTFKDQENYSRHWLGLSPDNPAAHYYLARAYAGKGKLSEAKTHYKQALIDNLLDAQVYNNLGLIEYEMKNFKPALVYFNKAVAVNPDYALLYNNKALAMIALGEVNEALQLFSKSTRLDPRLLEPRLNMASIYLRQKKYGVAKKLFEDILSIDPVHPDALTILMRLHILSQEPQLVHQYAQSLLSSSQNAAVLMNAAGILRNNNYVNMAALFYNKVLSIESDTLNVYFELGNMYREHGKRDEALIFYKEGLKQDPENAQLKKIIHEVMVQSRM